MNAALDGGCEVVPRATMVSGVGVHSGRPATVVLRSCEPGAGITFTRLGDDASPVVRARVDSLDPVPLRTRLQTSSFAVETVEHLLAACAAHDLWDLAVAVAGPELPIGDGSADLWSSALDRLADASLGPPGDSPAGMALAEWPPPVPAPVVLDDVVEVRDGERLVRLEPGAGRSVSCTLLPFPGLSSLGPLSVSLPITRESFQRELSWARTFVREADAQRLLAAGHGRGATLENTLLIGEDGVQNPRGARGPSEPTRHKIVDALGDLALLGAPWQGHLVLRGAGHRLHHELARRVLDAARTESS